MLIDYNLCYLLLMQISLGVIIINKCYSYALFKYYHEINKSYSYALFKYYHEISTFISSLQVS